MEAMLIFSLTLLGAILGSFANVCIWRLPRGESIAWPPSHCLHCHGHLRPWHLVPVFSWLFLRGKCAMCHRPIPLRYPLVELGAALLFGLIAYYWGLSLQTLIYSILTLALVISVGTDFSHQEIPDQVSLGAAAVLAVIALVSFNWNGLLGGAVLFGILFLIALASRGGIGGGDIKLALAIGLALGWQLGLVALVIGFLAGGLLAAVLLLRGYRGTLVPFGPFLALGAWTAMFWGEQLIDFYWNLSFLLWRW